jgi:16S rRNA processing protein RimM
MDKKFEELIEQDIVRSASSRECSITGNECNKYDAETAENLRAWFNYIQNCKKTESTDVFWVSDNEPEFVDVCSQCGVYKEYHQTQKPWRCYKGFVSQKIRDFFCKTKMIEQKKILIGKIVAFQGVRGDVRIQTYTEKPEDFRNLKVHSNRFAVDDFRFVRRLNPGSDVIIAHIRGFENRTEAEVLRGTELFALREELPQPRADEYYQADLIGMTVIQGGTRLGRVVCFHNFGAGDIMELDTGDMVAFRGVKVDFESGNITKE